MIISRTPFRVSFFGGGTDYPEFYRQYGGSVLLTSIDKYCYISVHELSPFFKHRFRASYAKTESVLNPREFEHPLIRETLTFLNVVQGVEISHVADLPGRTGLGSSSSFTVGLLHALHVFLNQRFTAEDLARESIIVERERVGDSGGHQDQYAAAYGGLIRLDFNANGPVSIKRLAVGTDRIAEIENHMLLFYTGVEKSAEQILVDQKLRTEKNLEPLKELASMVNAAEYIITFGGDIREFGRILHHGWQIKRGLASGISNDVIDVAYQAARDAGALGGKLLGAGGRGFLLLFAPPEKHLSIREKLSPLQEVVFKFSSMGSEIIFNTQHS